MSGAPDVGGSLGASAQPAGTPRGRAPGRPAGQVASGLALGVGLPAAVTFAAQLNGDWLGLPATTLALLLAMVLATLVGGLVSALVSALVGSALLNYFFIPPYHSLAIGEPHNVLTVGLFVGVGVIVSAVVNRAAREASEATRASAEARTLAALADSALQGAEALPTMLEQARASFGMTSAALLSRRNAGEGAWLVLGSVGPEAPTTPALADVCVDAGPGQRLALAGRTLGASDQLVLRAFAAQAASLLERDRLARAAEAAERLKATDRLCESLLLAVGHDLRRPLASASAAVESLRNPQIGLVGRRTRRAAGHGRRLAAAAGRHRRRPAGSLPPADRGAQAERRRRVARRGRPAGAGRVGRRRARGPDRHPRHGPARPRGRRPRQADRLQPGRQCSHARPLRRPADRERRGDAARRRVARRRPRPRPGRRAAGASVRRVSARGRRGRLAHRPGSRARRVEGARRGDGRHARRAFHAGGRGDAGAHAADGGRRAHRPGTPGQREREDG